MGLNSKLINLTSVNIDDWPLMDVGQNNDKEGTLAKLLEEKYGFQTLYKAYVAGATKGAKGTKPTKGNKPKTPTSSTISSSKEIGQPEDSTSLVSAFIPAEGTDKSEESDSLAGVPTSTAEGSDKLYELDSSTEDSDQISSGEVQTNLDLLKDDEESI